MSVEPGSERLIAGRYRLLSPLGEGGMGTVWRARDELLNREVAVKEVRAPSGLPASDIERMYARLEREAWAAARISHHSVVTVYDVATQDNRPWIVMELVRGISLAELLEAEGPLAPQRAAHIGAEVLSALRAAHEAGVQHRDVKPANVLLSNDGRVVLTDFGIAMVEGSSALTMTGEVIGSPEFLAPERALGRTPGPESDLWSLGVLLYAAVEGSSPFRHDTPLSTLRAIVDEELPPPYRAGPLAPVIEGLLRKDPAQRLSADRAERDLRVIGAGGTPSGGGTHRTDAVRAAPYPPTAARQQPPQHRPPHDPSTTPAPVPPPVWTHSGGTATATHPPDRNRRAAVVLVAGVAALALAVAGLTYTLLNGDDGDKAGGGPKSETTGLSSPSLSDPGTEDTPEPSRSSPSPSPSTTSAAPPPSVKVTLAGSHTEYSGPCPPPQGEAPAFTATITVGSLPSEVTYRWVSQDGEIMDPEWKTLEFPEGGGRSKQDTAFVTTNDESGTFENEISVEVRDPVETTSNSVPFSVTCVAETPSDEASASVSASP
ncbi:serine/threonine-protein kinase [Streptomyces resistomycificus]|uniref:non-specific serine/threonine protein kinase n=1 Tax=Streptomyces resistomycificus TaxID=67356 RepID=A0A0L8LZ42_9ACTN|nr:serine/threonine-protein kinase [Streptomyces resistomycificus]KOG43411.1 protein kinase [Streptomyces resistomycificus]KUN91527.1 protein kinase [Streptomyces resistomycificus]